MRIAVSADTNNEIDSLVGAHFGRCPYFVLVDVDGTTVSTVKTVDNPFYGNHAPGQVPGFIRSQGGEVMLAGGMGRRAVALFAQMGIEAVTGASGTVRQAVERYLGGELSGVEPCAEGKFHGEHGHDH